MFRFMRYFIATLLLTASLAQAAPPEAQQWLHRMNQAARSLNYSGIYTYEVGGRAERIRVTHVADGMGQKERLEPVDGGGREVVRINDEVQTYFPQERLLIIERALSGSFPGRAATVLSGLSDFYVLRMGEPGKVAARDAQVIRIEPRDELRYGHELWADAATGLLLRARMLKPSAEPVEQFGFDEIVIGGMIDRDRVLPRYSRGPDWKVVNTRGTDLRAEELPWQFRGLPPGFRQVSLSRRPIGKEGPEALHAVFSDGLATVSVFIESSAGRTMSRAPRLNNAGPVSMYRSTRADVVVTAVGEVPPETLRRIADGVEPTPARKP